MTQPEISIAQHIYQAEKERRDIPKVTDSLAPNLTEEEAYQIQDQVLALRQADGHQIIAPKMGLTSQAKWEQMGVDAPIVGYLFDDMLETNQTIIYDKYIHPKVEPEIGIVLKEEIGGADLTLTQIADKVDYVFSCVEVIDSRYQNFDFTYIDVIMDNTSAKGANFGQTKFALADLDLPQEQVQVFRNGDLMAQGQGSDVLGHPLQALVELGKHLDKKGQKIPAGQPIMTGGLSAAVTINKGDLIEVKYSHLEDLSIRVE